jgi:hypothetical protein
MSNSARKDLKLVLEEIIENNYSKNVAAKYGDAFMKMPDDDLEVELSNEFVETYSLILSYFAVDIDEFEEYEFKEIVNRLYRALELDYLDREFQVFVFNKNEILKLYKKYLNGHISIEYSKDKILRYFAKGVDVDANKILELLYSDDN